MTTNVTAEPVKVEPDHFTAIAAELRRVANQIATLVGSGLPKPRLFQLNIQPGATNDDDVTATAVDAMAGAILGHPAKVQLMSGGTYHYGTDHEQYGPLEVVIYQGVSTEWALKREQAAALAVKEAELEKLRAEVAELRAVAAPTMPAGVGPLTSSGYDYTRADTDADDPTPVSPARVPLHHGGSISGIADDGHRVSEPSAPVDETMTARHYEASGWKGVEPDSCGVACACGVTYDGFDSLADAAQVLSVHIEAANAEPAPVCVYETGGGSAVRERCGDRIEQGENGLWRHVGTTWHNHVAQPERQPAVALIRCGCGPTHTPDCRIVPEAH